MKSAHDLTDQEIDDLYNKSAPSDASTFELAPQTGVDNPLQTAAKTAVDEYSLQYYPQIAAGVKKAAGDERPYTAIRDNERTNLVRGQFENEGATAVGKVLGVAGQVMTPIGDTAAGVAEAARLGKPIAAQVAKSMGINSLINTGISALKNPGDVDGEVNPLQLPERMQKVDDDKYFNVGMGIIGGAVNGKLAEKGAKAPEDMVAGLNPTPTKAITLVQDNAKRAYDVGGYILENNLAKVGDSPAAIMEKTSKNLKAVGTRLGNFLRAKSADLSANKTVDDIVNNPTFKPEVHFAELQDIIQSHLAKAGKSGSSEVAEDVVKQAVQDYNSLLNVDNKNISKGDKFALALEGLNQMKRFMQEQVLSYDNLKDTTKNAGAISEGFAQAAIYFEKKAIEEIERFGNTQTGKALQNLNKQYSLASDANFLATRNRAKDFSSGNASGSVIGGTGAGAAAWAITKNPAATAMAVPVGAYIGSKMSGVSPTSKAAMYNKLQGALKFNPVAKAGFVKNGFEDSGYQIDKELPPPPPPSAHEIDQKIKKDTSLSHTQKAKLRNENRKNN